MSVYWRYFRIKDTATLAEIERLWQLKKRYLDSLREIKTEIGAKDIHTYANSGHLAGFSFENRPDAAVYREPERGIFYPKKSSKNGKDICKRIDAISRPESMDEAIRAAGLVPGFGGAIVEGLTFYQCALCGSDAAGWFASVPWQDRDPAEIAQYKIDREAGTRSDSTLSRLLWVSPIEWEEVKEWQVRKALGENKSEEVAA